MKKHHHILITLMVLSVATSLCVIPACKPQRGGVDTGTPCGGADARLASSQGGVAKVPLSVYRGLSYGAQMTWANNKTNNAPTIHSCASVVSLEEENGELVAYVATAYHCVRNMAEQQVSGTVNEYALYFNIAADADCQTTEGKKPNYVKVDFDINKSEYLSKLAAKIQNLKSQNSSINIAQHDRAWLEKSLGMVDDSDEKQMLEDLKGNLKSPEDIANDIKLFNQSFDYHVCTTSPLVATSKAKHPSYEDFHRVITSYNDSSHNISNACFLSNDVVFLKINLNKTILSYESTHKCLKTSHLTTEMSNNNKPVPLTLNIGSHPKNQSEWSRAVVSFHDEALQWDSQEQQSREWRTEKHHQNLYSKIMNETFHKSTNIINQGTESKDDDLIVNFQEIMDYSQDQRHLRLLTFYKDGDNDPYQFKKLKLSYSKNQPQIDDGFMALYGSVYGIVLRKWGISLMLSSLKVHPGSSGSLMISGNETIGYEIMAALYSKDGQEYSTAHGPIDKADFIGRMTPRTDTTQPSDDDNDEKRAYSGTSTSKTTPRDSSTQQSTAVGDTKKREPQSNRSGDLNPNPQPVDRPDVGKEDEGEVAENEQPTNNQPQQQEEKGDDDKNRENFYNIRDTGEDDVRARDFGCN